MASIRFNVKPAANNKMQIRAIFQDGSDQVPKNLGESIPANKIKTEYRYWDKKKQEVRGLDDADRINATISKWKTAFKNYKDDCSRKVQPLDIRLFILSLDGTVRLSNDEMPSLIVIIDLFITSIRATHSNLTVNGYTVIKNDIELYESSKKKKIYLSNIGPSFYKDFATFLIEHENNINSTVNRKQGKIITIVNYAVNDLKIKLQDLDYKKKYQLKESTASKFPLHPEELATLKEAKLTNKYRQMVKDAFIIACETGLRYSDIIQLQGAHIKSYVSSTGLLKFIDLSNIKTDNMNNMPLSDAAIKIIEKYVKPTGHLFTFHYSQSASKALKAIFLKLDLARPCEIVTKQGAKTTREILPLHNIISFHTARNTYITRLLSANVAPVFVQGNAGHADIKTTMSYFRNDDITRWQETLKVLNAPLPKGKKKPA